MFGVNSPALPFFALSFPLPSRLSLPLLTLTLLSPPTTNRLPSPPSVPPYPVPSASSVP